MSRTLGVVIVLLLLAVLQGCGGSNSSATQAGSLLDQPGVAADTGASEQVISEGQFALHVLSASYDLGGSAEFSLQVTTADSPVVRVEATASELKSALIRLDYPAARLHPTECQYGGWSGIAQDELLQYTVLDDPGSVHHGSVLIRPQDRQGVTGRIDLLEVRFAPGAATRSRRPAAAPMAGASAIPDFDINTATGDCSFSHYNVGDYNQNSEVEIADITPLGMHFNEVSPDFPGAFPPDSIGSVIDGNGNGEIEIADLTPIGQNWGSKVAGWRVYVGTFSDYPESAADDNGDAELVATMDFPESHPADARLQMADVMPELVGVGGVWAWLRPVSDEGDEGIASNYDSTIAPDIAPPVWDYSPEGEGVIQVIPLDGGLRIIWGSATDASQFSYEGWVQEGTEVDFEQEPDFVIPASELIPRNPKDDQLTEVTGLTNGTAYAVAVRARDVHDNETGNTNLLPGTPQALAEVPSSITEDTTFNGPMKVSDGNTVVVENAANAAFMGDLTIEEGGEIRGIDNDLNLHVYGNLLCNGTIKLSLPDTLPGSPEDAYSAKLVLEGDVEFGPTSVVTGNGNLYLVDAADELVDPADVEDEMDQPLDTQEYFYGLDYDPGSVAAGKAASSVSKVVSRTVYYGPKPWSQWLVQGNWGTVPVQPRDVHRVVLRIWPVNGQLDFQDFSITGPDGRPGTDDNSCNAHGGDGQDNNWRFRIHCGRSLGFNNVNIKLGNGGRGGNATTPQDCDPGVAVGGKGGKALNKFRFTAGLSIYIAGSMNFNPGNGGAGGTATAYGKKGNDGCLADDGAEAFATGGDGGAVPRWGVHVQGAVSGTGNCNLGIAEGGVGGLATAWGGSGGNDTCLPGAKGGNGGYAEATGGVGGDSTFSDTGGGCSGGGATGGTGGAAHAAGGSGGNGASWDKIPGGDGGNGADASATGGDGGEATGDGAQTQGEQGAAQAIGGNGGNGGDGLPPGKGGEGGTATANGNPADELDGVKGLDGNQSPISLSEHIINLWATLPVGPVAPGDYLGEVFNRGDMTHIGDLIFTLYQEVPGEGEFAVIEYPEAEVLHMEAGPTGAVGLHISKSNMNYFDPADDAPWVGIEYSYDFTEGPVGVGFWFGGIPLDDYLIPPHPMGSINTEQYFVTPGLFYESFPPDPSVPPQWDDCDIYCMPTGVMDIVEIVVLDP